MWECPTTLCLILAVIVNFAAKHPEWIPRAWRPRLGDGSEKVRANSLTVILAVDPYIRQAEAFTRLRDAFRQQRHFGACSEASSEASDEFTGLWPRLVRWWKSRLLWWAMPGLVEATLADLLQQQEEVAALGLAALELQNIHAAGPVAQAAESIRLASRGSLGAAGRWRAAMPQQFQETILRKLTQVPVGWPLETVIDAFAALACHPNDADAARALERVSRRLVDLWAAQPAEAQAWLQQCRELYAKELAGKAGLLRGEPLPWEEFVVTARYLQSPHICDPCRQLAGRLVAAESQETARKRQKLEEETAERRRLEAELQKSQEEGRDLRNRLASVEARVCSKTAELQTAQSESTKCKELGQLQDEHGKCQERCEELVARLEAEASKHAATKECLSQAESDVAESRMELQRLQEASGGYQKRCQQAEAWFLADEAGSKAELLLQKAVFQDRCDQLRQQLSKAEAERSAMLGQMQGLWEDNGMYKERARELEKQLLEVKESHHLSSGHDAFGEAPGSEVSDGQQPDLAEQLGYSFVDDDGTSSSVLSRSSWFSVKPDSVKPHCFMVDAIFKTRSYGTDFFLMGRDLKKGSQVVAGDDTSILEVAKTPEICDASEVVELQAGAATLQVTPDHLVRVADPKGEAEDSVYLAAGQLKAGDLVMLDSGEVAALSSVVLRREACQVLKIVFEPYMPVAVFSRPTCILSLGHKKKRPIRRGGRSREVPSDDSMDGGVSVPVTAGEYMD
ncbi:hypothetical protein AK812_SmicGene34352 [Symbiodinium microadriaticum]|uniref:Hint domain-containing protein n=1 Tax=Symbiodinium microadriaticum TaxID=2951 RepID=A0A1Q9CP90_SYMMI|nr:hypothetical protein AK812_SmicGene34352 [Symbiodinium microadriaticum]